LVAAWFLGGFVRDWRGDPEGAVEHFTHAMRLSPLDPEMYRMQAGMAIAHIFAGRFEEAAIWAKRAYREMPAQLMVAAASFALAGRLEEARQAMDRLRELDPTLRPSNVTKYVPISRPQDIAVFVEGLRKAGLPD
jgi:Flp pilus assembly protein TadD